MYEDILYANGSRSSHKPDSKPSTMETRPGLNANGCLYLCQVGVPDLEIQFLVQV
ncbi:predicted protein [Botrytis cinerea T4]|uniref:Uncharacterized protein n=1 Tax=Botryotinia fuckeliana (strain T4) TaxID=999810 RepID=G2Y4N0_BOTF4|nr:predicted protein [Botrytis cinerea T4]